MYPPRLVAAAASPSALLRLRPPSRTLMACAPISSRVGVGGADASSSQRRRASSLSISADNLQRHDLSSSGGYHQRQQRRHFARQGRRGGRSDKFDRYTFDDPLGERGPPRETKNVLVIGSCGVLGRTLVSHFGVRKDWNVLGADVMEPGDVKEKDVLGNYVALPKDGSVADLTVQLYRGVQTGLHGGEKNRDKLDAIVCASGGWAGDVDIANLMDSHLTEADSSELEDVDFEEEYARESAEVCESMMRMNYYPVVAGSQVGRRFLKRNGLFVVIGASAALSPTPGMLGYGSAKSAAHHYLQSWGPSASDENNTTAVGILPLMIDTPANRAMLGGGDDDGGGDERYSKMVKPMHIAKEIGEWIESPHLRPHSGSLVKVIAKNRRDGSGGAAFHLAR